MQICLKCVYQYKPTANDRCMYNSLTESLLYTSTYSVIVYKMGITSLNKSI